MDTWRKGGNQDLQGNLENRREQGNPEVHDENSRKPEYPGVPGEQEETRISRGTMRTGGN